MRGVVAVVLSAIASASTAGADADGTYGGKVGLGVNYPGLGLRYCFSEAISVEGRGQMASVGKGAKASVYGGRLYWAAVGRLGPVLPYVCAEGDLGRFDDGVSKASGYAGGLFVGLEYFVRSPLSIQVDVGPAYVSLGGHSVSVSDVYFVTSFGLTYYVGEWSHPTAEPARARAAPATAAVVAPTTAAVPQAPVVAPAVAPAVAPTVPPAVVPASAGAATPAVVPIVATPSATVSDSTPLSSPTIIPQAKVVVAVADLQTQGVPPDDAAVIADLLRAELGNAGLQVLEKSNVDKVLAEHAFPQAWCSEQECAVKMGKLLNVRRMVVGLFGKLMGKYVISLRLVDVESGDVIFASSASGRGVEEIQSGVNDLALMIASQAR